MSTLITAANSAQAQQLKSVLATEDIVLGDYQDIPDFMVKSGKLIKTPNPNSPAFIHEMLALCLDKGITRVFALRKQELLLLSEATLLFSEFDIQLSIPPREAIHSIIAETDADSKITITPQGVYKGSQIFIAD